MKTRLLILILFLISFSLIKAQDETYIAESVNKINQFWNEDEYTEAISAINLTIPVVVKVYGKNSPQYCRFLIMSAQIFYDAEQYSRALSVIDECLLLYKRNKLDDEETFAKILACKGLFLKDLGKSADAISLFAESISHYSNSRSLSSMLLSK